SRLVRRQRGGFLGRPLLFRGGARRLARRRRVLRVLFGRATLGDTLAHLEGGGVVYDQAADGSLRFDHALADDGTHDAVALTRAQAFTIDQNRPTFYS